MRYRPLQRCCARQTLGMFDVHLRGTGCQNDGQRSGMADDEVCEFSAEQILDQSSAYPLMADSECQMSTVILSAAYPELRYVKGTRRRIYAVSGAELQA